MNKLRLTLLFSLGIGGCALFTQDNHSAPAKNRLALQTAKFQGELSWVEQPASSAPIGTLVGIHGTPGSWTAWQPLMAQPGIEAYNFHAFDRPGWADSQAIDGAVFTGLADQADLLALAIGQLPAAPPLILVAHSWGGPVALALAARYPDLIDGLVVIAAPADPKVTLPRWYHKAAKIGPIRWLIGQEMARSNLEMLSLANELQILAPHLAAIRAPTLIMQGKKDWLVAPQNAFYLDRMLVNAHHEMRYDLEANHFIPFKQTDAVLAAIQWVAGQVLSEQPPAER
ncbi:alpha/beta fold hydrolase [Reinekea sp.]|jgi:pimeloyl-ACP methyl ester carboxylesterase|uniref:alpha/beta fold hydrolase n=1 Tax=Reinekea sp. TaxID=1970455 RepID=UPI002A803F5D|nr:alpha/beta fold hydrolase [Reinekea sp.]